MEKIKLLPCPFCGREAKEVISPRCKLEYRIRCANITCTVRPTTPYFEDLNEAVRKWNNRAAEAEIRANVLDEFIKKLHKIDLEREFSWEDMYLLRDELKGGVIDD